MISAMHSRTVPWLERPTYAWPASENQSSERQYHVIGLLTRRSRSAKPTPSAADSMLNVAGDASEENGAEVIGAEFACGLSRELRAPVPLCDVGRLVDG